MSEIQGTEPTQLQSHVEIDDLLIEIAASDRQIEQLESLKAHRVAPIDTEIAKLKAAKELHRGMIAAYMAKNEEKSLKYPGLASVTRSKTGKGKWVVLDEEKLLTFLYTTLKERPDVLSKVVKAEPKIVKKELDKALEELKQAVALPEEAVAFTVGDPTLTITFEKTDALLSQVKDKAGLMSGPANADPAQAFDALEF